MSWLFKSLQSNEDDPESSQIRSPEQTSAADRHDGSTIKDYVSILLCDIDNFLAPPLSTSSAFVADSLVSSSLSKTLDGIRNDLVEIEGIFKSSLLLLSSNKVVTGISELASQLSQFDGGIVEEDQEDDDDDGVVPGTTDEVV